MKPQRFGLRGTLMGFVAAALFASCVFTSGLEAQETLNGRVVDSASAPIPNAVVSLAELRLATTTSSDGAFTFAGVPSGKFTLVVRRAGFASAVREIVVPNAGDLIVQLSSTPFQVEPVTITATRLPTTSLRSPLPTSALSEDQLRREQSISVAKSLSKLAGVQSVSTGDQIGKPMIRGLFGSRVLVLENGSRLEDYSWSDEDAPSVDARLAQRVEVIRGPASVLYGSDAVGGVVNVVPEDLPSTNGGRAFHQIGVEAYGATNNKELGSA